MDIKDVIGELKDNNYVTTYIDPQAQQIIFDYVYATDKEKPFVGQSCLPTHFVYIFFNTQLPQLVDSDETIGRYLLALFKSQKEDKYATCILLAPLLKYLPDFYQQVTPKHELMSMIFADEGQYNDIYGIERLKEIGFSDADLAQFSQSEQHLENGHSLYRHNLHLKCTLLPQIQQAYQQGDSASFDDLLLEYCQFNLRDYHRGEEVRRRKKMGEQYRTKLAESEVQRFVQLLVGQGDWQQDIAAIANGLVTATIDDTPPAQLTLLHCDKDFSQLVSVVFQPDTAAKLPASKYLANFSEILRLLDPSFWCKNIFSAGCLYKCSFNNSDHVLGVLDSAIEKHPQMKVPLISFVLSYLGDHYTCCLRTDKYSDNQKFNSNTHLSLLASLVERFGAVYLFNCYQPQQSYRPERVYALLAQLAADDPLLQQLKLAADEDAITHLLKAICGETLTDDVKKYILTGQSPGSVANLTVTNLDLPPLYWLNNVYIERLAQLYFNGNNDDAAVEFIIEANHYLSAQPLRLLSDVVIEHPALQPAYFKALVIYSAHFIALGGISGRNGRYFLRHFRVAYHTLIPQLELCYLQQHNVPCVEHILSCSNPKKVSLLTCLVGTITESQQALALIGLLKEKTKVLLDCGYDNIKALPVELREVVITAIIKQLGTFKGQHEINAVTAICLQPLDADTAARLISQVKQSKSRSLLVDHAKLDFSSLFRTNPSANDQDSNFDLTGYLAQFYQQPKKPLVNQEITAALLTKQDACNQQSTSGDKSACGKKSAEQLLQIYQNHDQFTVNSEASAIISALDDSSFQTFNANILATYLDKITAKNRWLLALPAIHGNAQCIKILSNAVEKWANGAKHQLAAHVIMQMGASGVTQAYVAIERIGRNSKKQSIKDAVNTAFIIGANKQGITKDQLGDSLVEDIGFVGDEIPLRYCKQDYALLLSKELKFAIRKPDGKIAKSLPKPKVDDDSEAAAQVAKDFIVLKKLLKGVVELQSHRLQDAFVIWRHWSSEQWTQLFINNPVMNKLASRLVWGLYQENRLIKVFTVNPQPIDLDDQAVAIESQYQIGLVHGSELDAAQLSQWLEYFDDWGLELLFNQLNGNEIDVVAKQVNASTIEDQLDYDVTAPRKSPSTVINRLRKKGWAVGSVRDAGSFEELYKEIESLNVGIEITFDDSVYHGDYGYECDEGDITIAKVQFYRTNAIQRGSYCYDELEETDSRLDKTTLPVRLTQELVREAILAFS